MGEQSGWQVAGTAPEMMERYIGPAFATTYEELGACPRKKSLKNNVLELRRCDLKISPFPETRVLTGDQNFLIFSKNT